MRKKILAAFILLSTLMLTGCGISNVSDEKTKNLDYTVVATIDLPGELRNIIDDRKKEKMHFTYTVDGFTYMILGYGECKTSGYSICVNEVYEGENKIVVDTSLIGPKKNEKVSNNPTYPFIVLKIEERNEVVEFKE